MIGGSMKGGCVTRLVGHPGTESQPQERERCEGSVSNAKSGGLGLIRFDGQVGCVDHAA